MRRKRVCLSSVTAALCEKMKKVTTYYFLALITANILLAHFMAWFTPMVARQYEVLMEGRPLPAVSQVFMSYPWWPYVFVVFFAFGALISALSHIPSSTLVHLVIACLFCEAFVLFMAIVAFASPLIPYISPLG